MCLLAALGVASCDRGPAQSKASPPTTTRGDTQRVDGAPGAAKPNPDKNADNTGRNERDRSGETLTPPDQSGKTTDFNITVEVRRAIVDDKTMSLNAHNAKIITVDGVVTLRGPVDSQQEKDALEAIAAKCTGVTKVLNELEVKAR
jgi:hyperosmotically inducible periplasmic protein